ncbi:MAG TPA: glucosaminidase domain-containing protein [Cyclobacteriaceae bacterium]|nr:glucosaminidase domain-containing protein [Cyclobacteriaceae bacterium]
METNYLKKAKWIIITFSALLIAAFLILSFTKKNVIKKEKVLLVEYRTVHYCDEIEAIDSVTVKPFIYDCRADLSNVPIEFRKKKFIDLVLPAILVVKHELMKESIRTSHLMIRLKNHMPVVKKDSAFIAGLFRKYQTESLYEVTKKQQVHPTSLIIAQAALESGWGTSRFFQEGNNLFGIKSYNPADVRVNSLVPNNGNAVFLKKYPTLKACIEDYFLTIANSWAYQDFRKKREEASNPYELIWYLQNYSELRYDYVKKVGELMVHNELDQFDDFTISKDFLLELSLN